MITLDVKLKYIVQEQYQNNIKILCFPDNLILLDGFGSHLFRNHFKTRSYFVSNYSEGDTYLSVVCFVATIDVTFIFLIS